MQAILHWLSYQGSPGGLCDSFFRTCLIQRKFPEVFVQRRGSLAVLLASLIQEQWGRELGFRGLFFCSHDPEFQRKDRVGNFCCVGLERPLLSMKRMTVKRTEALRGCRAPFPGGCFSGLDFCSTLQGRYVSRSELGRGKGG